MYKFADLMQRDNEKLAQLERYVSHADVIAETDL